MSTLLQVGVKFGPFGKTEISLTVKPYLHKFITFLLTNSLFN